MPFLKEEKSEHERARSYEIAIQLRRARHCELPLSKMGIKGLFPGVAVPLAFFCTLFFRHRKKSVSAPWNGKSHSRAGVGASSPGEGFSYSKVAVCCYKQGAFLGANNRQRRHTAVRSACCLPELRVISAFGGQPTGLIFPSVPPCTPSVSPSEKNHTPSPTPAP